MTTKLWLRRGLIAAIALPTAFGLATSTPMAAVTGSTLPTADPNVQVTNTETVQVRLDPSGKVKEARIYEQLSFTGKGKLNVSNPVSTDGLRDLDGFGGFSVKDGAMVTDLEVDGDRRLRAVSDFDKSKLPLKVSVSYMLDDKPVKPSDVVGKSGKLTAHYRVENTSAQPRPIALKDGLGKDVSEEADVVIPLVGQLATVLPPEFTEVASKEANKAGDGKGGTKLSFTVTLFPPIGSAVAEFGWSADVRDAIVPPAELTALPVSPLDSPTFATGVSGYTSGAQKGADLATGGTTIDTNLMKLRDGANKLLSGLLQMNAGAAELKSGLVDRAAPGAWQLSDGASDLKDGLVKLDNGADRLAVKLGEASEGSGKLKDGAGKLNDGITKIDAGAQQLKDGQHKQAAGAKQLKTGIGTLDTGAGKLKAGTGKVNTGARQLKAGTTQLSKGLDSAAGSTPSLISGLGQVKAGLDKVEQGLIQMYGGIGQLPAKARPLHDGIARLRAGIGTKDDESTLLGGMEGLKDQLAATGPGIDKMIAGVYRESADKATAGAYQKIGCAVDVVKALRDGKAAGTFDNPHDRFCYGPQWVLLNAIGIPAEPDLNVVRKTVMASLSSELAAGRQRLADPDNLVPDIDKPLPDDATLQLGLAYLKGRLTERAVPGIVKLQCGLDNTSSSSCDESRSGLVQGLALADAGISQLVSSVVSQIQGAIGEANDTPASNTLRGGINGLQSGVSQIHAGGQSLLAGLIQLADGAGRVDSGMGTLSGGIGQVDKGVGALVAGMGKANTGVGALANGAGQLDKGQSDLAGGTRLQKAGQGVLLKGTKELDIGLGLLTGGAHQIADGTGEATDGSRRLATGAGELSTGIGTAADGMTRLADGIDTASKTVPQLPDGLQRLSNEGAKKLVRNGQDTAIDFGRRYALMAASAERAKAEGMPFGAPEGAASATAYSLKLAGATGEGGRSFGRGLAALGVFAVALGITGLVRRRFA